MPHRTFTLDAVAQYLSLPRAEIEQLVQARDIPCTRRGGQVVFLQAEIDDWASQRILGFNAKHLAEYDRKSSQASRPAGLRAALLPGLIRPAGIAPAMTAKTKDSALRDLAAVAEGTGLVCDVAELLASLQAREQLCSTAVPGGVAFPHPRQQQPYLLESSFMVLGRTLQPIHFGAPDGQPTDLFFLLCCQEEQLHLHALARLCLMAQKSDLLAQLRAASDVDALHEGLLAAEQAVLTCLHPAPSRDHD
jgi:nitrogen PTS system EIIA component